MDIKTSAARGDARRTPPPWDEGADLLLSASPSAAHYRAAADRARLLQSLTTTPRLKHYLEGIIALFEGRAVDIEADVIAARNR
jgi:hypothetical protein